MSRGDGDIIKTGVIGAGVFGRFHAQKVKNAPNATLTFIHDRHEDRAAALASETGAIAIADLDRVFAEVDAVIIAAPATAHASLAERALNAGVHSYVEKPLALDEREAADLVALAEERNCVLQVGHQERFVANAFGVLDRAADAQSLFFRRCGPGSGRCEDVSVIWDLMVHDLDLARQCGFGEPRRIEARGDEHAAFATLTFDGDRQIRFFASRRSPDVVRTAEIRRGDSADVFDFVARGFCDDETGAAEQAREAVRDPLDLSVRAFLAAIASGDRPLVNGRDGLRAVDWAQRIEDVMLRDETIATKTNNENFEAVA